MKRNQNGHHGERQQRVPMNPGRAVSTEYGCFQDLIKAKAKATVDFKLERHAFKARTTAPKARSSIEGASATRL